MLKNNFRLIGRLTKEPVIKRKENEEAYILFTLVQKIGTDPLYFDCILKKIDLIQHMKKNAHKGFTLAIEGIVIPSKWQDVTGTQHKEFLISVYDLVIYPTTAYIKKDLQQKIGMPDEENHFLEEAL